MRSGTDDHNYPAFAIKFAESSDLVNWTILRAIYGTDRYTAYLSIRYCGGWFYMFYLEGPGREWWFETYLTRSRHLVDWE